jgi:hypothetical protein
MTMVGNPSVYRKGDIIVIVPTIKTHIMDALGFELLFDFSGIYDSIRTQNKKIFKFENVFGEDRMAKLLRISMDIDKSYDGYLKSRKIAQRERAKVMRKSKIIAVKDLVVNVGGRNDLVCPLCMRRYYWGYKILKTQCIKNCSQIEILNIESGYRVVSVSACT